MVLIDVIAEIGHRW